MHTETGGLTARQADALAFIKRTVSERGVSPSVEEIASGIGLKGRGGVHRLLLGLRDRRRIMWIPKMARSIEIIEPGADKPLSLPPEIEQRLRAYCFKDHENPADVLADAVVLHLDSMEGA